MLGKRLTPIRVTYERRNRDLDPLLVWRGKDLQGTGRIVPDVDHRFLSDCAAQFRCHIVRLMEMRMT